MVLFRWRVGATTGSEKVFTLSQLLAARVDHHLGAERPAFSAVENSMIARTIKLHLLGKTCVGWSDLPGGKAWYFATSKEKSPICLVWHNSKPSMLELVVANTSLFRFSANGIYTKKKDTTLSQPAVLSNLDELFSSMSLKFFPNEFPETSDQNRDESQHETSPPGTGQGPGSPAIDFEEQAALKRQLRRRLKTLRKTLAKFREDSYFVQEITRLGEELRVLQTYGYTLTENSFGKSCTIALNGEESMIFDFSEVASLGEAIEKRGRLLHVLKGQSFHEREQRGKVLRNMAQIEDALSGNIPAESVLGAWSGRNAANGKKKEGVHAEPRVPWYLYRFSDTEEILVGRTSIENDVLTKRAKGNDLWFHVMGGSGSHVVLPHRNKRSETVESQLKHYAAILAIHHSPRRGDRRGEVNIARRENLRKPKGFPPGKWLVQRSETVFISYEEPDLQLVLEAKV
jgi:hypothetical protein